MLKFNDSEIEFLSLKFIFRQNVSIFSYMKGRSTNSRYRFCVINISAFCMNLKLAKSFH